MHFNLKKDEEVILEEEFSFSLEENGEIFKAQMKILNTNAGSMMVVFDKLQKMQNKKANQLTGGITEDIINFINDILTVTDETGEVIEISSFETAYLLMIQISKEFLPKITKDNKQFKARSNKRKL